MEFLQDKNRFYLEDEDKKMIAEVTFIEDNNTLVIDHTFVDGSLRGQGIAKKLVDRVVDFAKENKKKVGATCSYGVKLMDGNDDYKDIYVK